MSLPVPSPSPSLVLAELIRLRVCCDEDGAPLMLLLLLLGRDLLVLSNVARARSSSDFAHLM
jgi:hypothetical protein